MIRMSADSGSERQSCPELKRPWSARPENLSYAGARLAIVRLIEYVAVTRQIGDVENVEGFSRSAKASRIL